MKVFAITLGAVLFLVGFLVVPHAPLGDTFGGDVLHCVAAFGFALPIWAGIAGTAYAIRRFRKTQI